MYLAFNVSHLKQDLTVGIIGLGYVGLPTAIGFHDAGFEVWGVDVSQRTVDMVRAGENPTGDPDVDDIVPAPGTERWNITRQLLKQSRIAMSSWSLCQHQLPTTSNQICPTLRQPEEHVFEVNSKGLKHHCCARINSLSRRHCTNMVANH